MKKALLLLFAVIGLSACSVYRISSDEIGDNFYRPKASPKEVIYMEDVSETPHEVIGYVTVNAERRQDIESVMYNIKREAAILGGDAITDIQSDATGTWKKLPGQALIGNAYVRSNFTAKVIVFKNKESESRLIK
jgi:hypothetical protein